jgi:hypothetical protein
MAMDTEYTRVNEAINKHLKTFMPDSFKRKSALTFSRRDSGALWKINFTKIGHEDVFPFSLL